MRWRSHRLPSRGAVVAAASLLACSSASLSALAGCSRGTHGGGTSSSAAAPPIAPGAPGSAPPGAIGLSPAGVTTRVDVPADSTEEQYFQACHAAKVWMDTQPGAAASLVEPYLATVQASPSGTPGSWDAPWSTLSPPRQAAVIIAARAAANGECG